MYSAHHLCNGDLAKKDVPKDLHVPAQRHGFNIACGRAKFFLKYYLRNFAWAECDCVERPVCSHLHRPIIFVHSINRFAYHIPYFCTIFVYKTFIYRKIYLPNW